MRIEAMLAELCENSRRVLNDTSRKTQSKAAWSLTPASFQKLLIWLDEGKDSGGRGYLAMRSRLVTYFDRKNCAFPDDLADETLNRVGRRLEEEGSIETESPAKYCYIVAKYVFLEHLRSNSASHVSLDEMADKGRQPTLAQNTQEDEAERRETMLTCLEECAGALEKSQHELIVGYYTGEKRTKIDNRRRLANDMGISMNALTIRAFRTREKLESCVRRCVDSKERN